MIFRYTPTLHHNIYIIIIGHKVDGGLRTEEEGISFQVSNINSQQPPPPKLIRNHMSWRRSKNIQLEYYHQSQVFKECNQPASKAGLGGNGEFERK